MCRETGYPREIELERNKGREWSLGASQLIHGLPWKLGNPLLLLRRHWNKALVLLSYRTEFLWLFVVSGKLTKASCPAHPVRNLQHIMAEGF